MEFRAFVIVVTHLVVDELADVPRQIVVPEEQKKREEGLEIELSG